MSFVGGHADDATALDAAATFERVASSA